MIRNLVNLLFLKKVEFLICISLFLTLFNNQLSAIFIGILVIIIFLDKKRYKFKLTKNSIITITFFLYLIIRELFDVDKKTGFDIIIRLLPILLLAITLGSYKFGKKQVDYITKYFIWINYIFYTSAILFGVYMFIINTKNDTIQNFSYYQWIVPINFQFHPPYWALLITLSMLLILINNRITNTKKYIFIGVSFLFLLLLSSRTALLAAFILLIINAVFNNSIKSYKKIIFVISIVFISSMFLFYSPYLSKKVESNSGLLLRQKLWNSSMESMKDNYLFGNSFSQSQLEIKSYYDKNNTTLNNYDPHNQFVYFGVSIGIVGLLLFLASMFYHENYHLGLILFLVIMSLSFMTESVLIRQMGVILYALFFNLISNKNFINGLSKT